ncbi:imidazole glycerol phosphate synthase subunit HisH, partial [Bacteroidetes bacterium SCGC AAA795-G10]
SRGLHYVGANVESSVDPDSVCKAERIVLPGVGAFASGMEELQALGMDEAVKQVAQAGRPILGICLGMQMLLDTSNEHGKHAGLGLIPGVVVPIPTVDNDEFQRKVPHIGWNALKFPIHRRNWNHTCLDVASEGTYYYFVHSFMAVPDNSEHILAECLYQGIRVTGAINKENITGLQFHPERSGPSGLAILRRFVAS